MKRSTVLALLGALLIAGIYVLVFRQTDEGKIRAQLHALSSAVHLETGENQIFRAKRIQDTFSRVFPPEAQVDVPDLHQGLAPRSELVTMAMGAGARFSTVALSFDAVRVDLEKPSRKAWVTSTATVSGATRDGVDRQESREVVMRFEESEGEWRITSIAVADSEHGVVRAL